MTNSKICGRCRTEKPTADFNRCKRDGHQRWCRACTRARARINHAARHVPHERMPRPKAIRCACGRPVLPCRAICGVCRSAYDRQRRATA